MKRKYFSLILSAVTAAALLAGCGSSSSGAASSETAADSTSSGTESSGSSEQAHAMEGTTFPKDATVEDILTQAAKENKIGDWGNGEQYEIQALLNKYNLKADFLNQGFDMSGFDDGSITLASAMSYNELGLIKNSYDGAYGSGDSVGVIDLNKEGISMVEDNLVCTRSFAEENPNTVKAFISATVKGWQYAAENPDEAAQIVEDAGSTLSKEHQKYMAEEIAKLASNHISGDKVTNYCEMKDEDLQQTLDLAKQYVTLDDSSAQSNLQDMTLDNLRDSSYYEDAVAGKFDAPEKTDIKIQLKWLAQSQFMGYYVALNKGYYKDAGLNVTINQGGGDISETTAVNSGQVDFASSWTIQTITANASGMDLIEVAQPTESAGMCMIYKIAE